MTLVVDADKCCTRLRTPRFPCQFLLCVLLGWWWGGGGDVFILLIFIVFCTRDIYNFTGKLPSSFKQFFPFFCTCIYSHVMWVNNTTVLIVSYCTDVK